MNANILSPEELETIRYAIAQFKDSELYCGTLGSCQYSSIEDSFNLCQVIIDKITYERFLRLFGISYTKTHTEEEFAKSLLEELIECYKEDEEDQDKLEVLMGYKTEDFTIEDYYEITNAFSWDLWSATILPFPLEILNDEDDYFGGEEDNHYIGLQIAIAKHEYGTDLSLYADYDT